MWRFKIRTFSRRTWKFKAERKNPTNTVGLYHVEPNLTITITEKLPEHAAQWGIHSLVIRLHMSQCEWHHPLSHRGSCDVPCSVSELLTSPCASPPASCLGTQNNNTSPFSLQQLPIPNCVRTEVFIPVTIRIVLFLIHKGSLKSFCPKNKHRAQSQKTFTWVLGHSESSFL